MLKKIILTLLIPLPLMAFALATAMFLEFQKLPANGAKQLSPMEFVQLKAGQLLQSQKARAAVSPVEPSEPKSTTAKVEVAPAKSEVKTAAAPKPLTGKQAAEIARAQAALQKQLQQQLSQSGGGVQDAAGKSFSERLTGLFSSKKVDEPEKPRRMVCKTQRGYKRCRFPKEK